MEPDAGHFSRRSDILTAALAVLSLGVALILGPEWGIPLVVCGLAGVILYFFLWKDKNPPWLRNALIGILILFLVTSGSVLAWKLLRPLPTLDAKVPAPSPGSPETLAKENAEAVQAYARLHPAPAAARPVGGSAVGTVTQRQAPCSGGIVIGGGSAPGGNCTTVPQAMITVTDTNQNYSTRGQFVSQHDVNVTGGVIPKLTVSVKAESLIAITLEPQPVGLWTSAPVRGGMTDSTVQNASGHLIFKITVARPDDTISFKFICDGADCATVYAAASK
jgi:hypothetical protein